jgi:hypothetical protein
MRTGYHSNPPIHIVYSAYNGYLGRKKSPRGGWTDPAARLKGTDGQDTDRHLNKNESSGAQTVRCQPQNPYDVSLLHILQHGTYFVYDVFDKGCKYAR